MSATLTKEVVTPEDLLRMTDGDRFELVDGQLRVKDMSFLSSYVAGNVYDALKAIAKARRLGWVAPEGATYQCFAVEPSRVRKADVSFIRLERLSEGEAITDGHCPIAPDLVVEVVSPNDLAYAVDDKADDWLAAGVLVVWVINPKTKRVSVRRANQPAKEYLQADVLTDADLLPGFQCTVAEFFILPTSASVP